MKLILTSSPTSNITEDSIIAPLSGNLTTIVKLFTPGSFDLIETTTPVNSAIVNLADKDLWKSLFSILKENADLSLYLSEPLSP